MTSLDLAVLFGVMLALAAMPSASVFLVVTRSAVHGIGHGVAAALGVVAGDLLFVLLVLGGLVAAAAAMGEYFVVARYLGGIYLVWFGLTLLRGRARAVPIQARPSRRGSFLAGLALTLGDIKAVFFYASLFPSFVDVDTLGPAQAGLLLLLTLVTVGAAKLGYALVASRLLGRLGLVDQGPARQVAGAAAVAVGVAVIAKA